MVSNISRLWGKLNGGSETEREDRAWLLSLLSAALALPTDAGGCVNRPYHVQKVLRTIPVVSANTQTKKTDWAVVVVVFFTLTDRASTIASNTRGCQSGT